MLIRTSLPFFVALFIVLTLPYPARSAVGNILSFEGSAPDGSYDFLYFDGQAIALRNQQILGSTDNGEWEVLFESASEIHEFAANENVVLAANFSNQTIAGSKISGRWEFKAHPHPKENAYAISAGEEFFFAMISDGQEEPQSYPHYTKDGVEWTPISIDYAGNLTSTFATPVGYFLIGFNPMFSRDDLYKADSPDGYWDMVEDIPFIGSLAYNKVTKRLLVIDEYRNAAYSTDGGQTWHQEIGPSQELGDDFLSLQSVGDQFLAIGDTYKFSQYGRKWNQIPSGYFSPVAFAENANGEIQTFYQAGEAVSLNSLAHLLGELYEVSNEEAIGYFAQEAPAVATIEEPAQPEEEAKRTLPTGNLANLDSYRLIPSFGNDVYRIAPYNSGIIAGTDSGLYYSVDGESFDPIFPSASKSINNLEIVGDWLWFSSGKTIYKTALSNFAPEAVHTLDSEKDIFRVYFAKDKIIVNTYGNSLSISHDSGQSFSTFMKPWFGGSVYGTAFGNEVYVIAGNDENDVPITASTSDFKKWNIVEHPSLTHSFNVLVFGNDRFLACTGSFGQTGFALTSSKDGSQWETFTIEGLDSGRLNFSDNAFFINDEDTQIIYTTESGWRKLDIPNNSSSGLGYRIAGQLYNTGINLHSGPLATPQELLDLPEAKLIPVNPFHEEIAEWDQSLTLVKTLSERSVLTKKLLTSWKAASRAHTEEERYQFLSRVMNRFLTYEFNKAAVEEFFWKTLTDSIGHPSMLDFLGYLKDDETDLATSVHVALGNRDPKYQNFKIVEQSYTPETMTAGPFTDLNQAYKRAIHSDIAGAAFDIYFVHSKGYGVPKDKAAEVFWLGHAKDRGLEFPKKDSTISKWKVYADQGSAIAQGSYSSSLVTDVLVENHERKAFLYAQRGARNGSYEAIIKRAKFFTEGTGTEPDPIKGIDDLKKVAIAGNSNGLYEYGLYWLYARGVWQDTKEAVNYLTQAAEAGNNLAMFVLSDLYLLGHGVEKDEDKAIEWLGKANANVEAAENRISKILDGSYQAKEIKRYRYPKKSRPFFDLEKMKKQARSGDASACYDLLQAYQNGAGVYPNSQIESAWYKQALAFGWEKVNTWKEAAEAGSLVATVTYASQLKTGTDSIEKDIELSNTLFFNAGYLRSHYGAQAELGVLYKYGRGSIEKNIGQAFTYFEMAAKNGNPYAQEQLGIAYDFGNLQRSINDSTAAIYYALAAAGGQKLAAANIAIFYLNGTGVEQSNKKAAGWFLRILDGNFEFIPEKHKSKDAWYVVSILDPNEVIGEKFEETNEQKAIDIMQAAANEGAPYGAELYAIYLNTRFPNQFGRRAATDGTGAWAYHQIAKERNETIFSDDWFDSRVVSQPTAEQMLEKLLKIHKEDLEALK